MFRREAIAMLAMFGLPALIAVIAIAIFQVSRVVFFR